MLKKNLSYGLIILLFVVFVFFFIPNDKQYKVEKVLSPIEFIVNGKSFILNNLSCLDSNYTENNKNIAKQLSISEDEAFILGNLGKDWAENAILNRKVSITTNDIIYYKVSYKTKFMFSGFCFKDSKPYSKYLFEQRLNSIRRGKYVVLDTNTEKVYNVGDIETKKLKNFLVLRKNYIPKNKPIKSYSYKQNKISQSPPLEFISGNIKVFVSDETTKIKPDRNCDTFMCKEILNNINNSSQTIDMAVYGYSKVPKIENAITSAVKRGVKVRLVCDSDSKGGNIYNDTFVLKKLITNNSDDKKSVEANSIMHNKFYIFDGKIVITGSTNLSHTDMSGFNTNIMVSLNSPKAAQIYRQEFEQMYNGKYHNDKAKTINNAISDKIKVYFSPQDKGIQNAILPLINNAKNYIYIPTFVLTEKRVTNSLIQARNRGVDIKIIMDALNASMRHTKHKELRQNGILVKTENYAGKMHAKTMIIDDRYVVIGSMNFSNSGENKNDENMLVIENPEIAKYLKQFFNYQWNKIDNKWLKYNARAEGKDSIGSCNDGLDNNYDGYTDADDSACKG